jgi:hypothetical protein
MIPIFFNFAMIKDSSRHPKIATAASPYVSLLKVRL